MSNNNSRTTIDISDIVEAADPSQITEMILTFRTMVIQKDNEKFALETAIKVLTAVREAHMKIWEDSKND
jgi:allophanate hydrolase subunit 1